jgi:hypothetical protein
MKHTYIIDTSDLQIADDGNTSYYGGSVIVTEISTATLSERIKDMWRKLRKQPRHDLKKRVTVTEFAARGTDRQGIDWPMVKSDPQPGITYPDILDFIQDQLHDLTHDMVCGIDHIVVIRCKVRKRGG